MSTITADEIKRRGVSAMAPVLEQQGEAVITVRGREKYVVMTLEAYNQFRAAELSEAVREARADYEAGRIADDSVDGHIRRLADEV